MDLLEVVWRNPFTFVITAFVVSISFIVWVGVQFDRQQQRRSTVGVEDESPATEPVFKNLPNFRQAGGHSLHNKYGKKVKDGMLFRSSRTDFLTEEETDQFYELGIKAIIDLRRNEEYVKAGGGKILDRAYQPCILKKGKIKDWKPPRRSTISSASSSSAHKKGKRYLVNVMTMDLVWSVVGKVNFFVRIFSLPLLVIDWFFDTHLFVRVYSYLVSNEQTLTDQYVEMLEYAKPVVADVMRLLLKDDNVPVLIHCAHGKDRTGVMVALILGCLDVDGETIAEDYSLSEAALAPIKKRLFRETVGRYGFKKEFARATVDTMEGVLRVITERYKSVSGYLSSTGFSLEEQQQLKDIFLE